MSGFLQALYSSGEGDFLHRAAHKEPELPCISSTGMPLLRAGEGGSAAALGSHCRGTRTKESLLSPPSTRAESRGRQGRQGSEKVPAQALAACSPACTAALQERREMRAPCLRRGHLMLAAAEIAWKPLF